MKPVVIRFEELVAIKKRKDQKQWTHPDIVKKTGLTLYAIRGLSSGRKDTLNLEEIAILCDFFDCKPGDLFAFVDGHEKSRDEEESEESPEGLLI